LVYGRLVSILAGATMGDVMRQYREGLFAAEVYSLREELTRLAEGRLFIWDDPLSVYTLAARVRAVARRQRVIAVLVDYLQMLAPPEKAGGSKYGTREQEVTAIAKSLHDLAVELNTAVVAAAQISRNNFQYSQRPRLTDLRESGGIEQYAQLVLGLWNSNMAAGAKAMAAGAVPAAPLEGWYWTPGPDGKSEEADAAIAMAASYGQVLLEVGILKSRWRGNVGRAIPLMLDGTSGRITDLPTVPGPIDPAANFGKVVDAVGDGRVVSIATPKRGRR